VLDYAPLAAIGFGIPQFLPQMVKLRATGGTAGVSWSWAALTAVNNAAWIGYFTSFRYWTALIASCSVTTLATMLTIMLVRRDRPARRPAVMIGAWASALAATGVIAGPAGLGTLLTAGFCVQVAPSLWTAYRTERPDGVSTGTWWLILGELACFLIYGVHESDPRLMVLGGTGVVASALMLARVYMTGRQADEAIRR
jgi:uncharacterized protein with PQ loop repeat